MQKHRHAPMHLLHFAARDGEREIIQNLLDRGADVNEPAETGWTALHFAAKEGHTFVVDLLLQAGANAEARTDEGYTPIDLAISFDRSSVIELLLKHGARDTKGQPRRPAPRRT